jgi:hypothetical protein
VLKQNRPVMVSAIAFAVVFASLGGYLIFQTSSAAQSELQSGISGNVCLDDYQNGGEGTTLDAYPCNGSPAQRYFFSNGLIHIGAGCARQQGASASWGYHQVAEVVIGACSSPAPWGAVWTPYGAHQFKNNHSAYCLNVSGGRVYAGVITYPCGGGAANESWYQNTYTSGGGSGGGGGCPSGVRASVSEAQSIAHCLMQGYGWDNATQFSCLNNIYVRESGWEWYAQNPAGGPYTAAYGIPQSNPGSKMASAGSDWLTNATTQIKWGLGYIKGQYGTPCGAWSYWMGHGNYFVPSDGTQPTPTPSPSN